MPRLSTRVFSHIERITKIYALSRPSFSFSNFLFRKKPHLKHASRRVRGIQRTFQARRSFVSLGKLALQESTWQKLQSKFAENAKFATEWRDRKERSSGATRLCSFSLFLTELRDELVSPSGSRGHRSQRSSTCSLPMNERHGVPRRRVTFLMPRFSVHGTPEWLANETKKLRLRVYTRPYTRKRETTMQKSLLAVVESDRGDARFAITIWMFCYVDLDICLNEFDDYTGRASYNERRQVFPDFVLFYLFRFSASYRSQRRSGTFQNSVFNCVCMQRLRVLSCMWKRMRLFSRVWTQSLGVQCVRLKLFVSICHRLED